MKNVRYVHFDSPMSSVKAREYINENLDHHEYLPFINYEIDKKKWDDNHKKLKETRTISVASIKDNYVYQYFNEMLSDKYENYVRENGFSSNVCAYRTGLHKSNINYFNELYTFLKNSDKAMVIISDYSKFFDNLDHKILKKNLVTVLGEELDDNTYKMLKSLEKPSYISVDNIITFLNEKEVGVKLDSDSSVSKFESISNYCKEKHIPTIVKKEWFRDLKKEYLEPGKEALKEKTAGIVQGTSASGTLSNIYMIDADREIIDMLKGYDALYLRYCDDMAIAVRNIDKKELKKITSKVQAIAESHKLTLNPDKVKTYDYSNKVIKGAKDGKSAMIKFLGFVIRDDDEVDFRQGTIDRNIHKILKSKKELDNFISENELPDGAEEELKKIVRKNNYEKLEDHSDKNKYSIGTYISRATKIIGGENIKKTKKKMVDIIDKQINKENKE